MLESGLGFWAVEVSDICVHHLSSSCTSPVFLHHEADLSHPSSIFLVKREAYKLSSTPVVTFVSDNMRLIVRIHQEHRCLFQYVTEENLSDRCYPRFHPNEIVCLTFNYFFAYPTSRNSSKVLIASSLTDRSPVSSFLLKHFHISISF